MKTRRSTEFRFDINGLRAWAVLSVVFYHFGLYGFRGGFVGVDLFFVISGYLMTRIIVSGIAREGERYSLFRFYMARAVRIIPALLVLCVILMFAGWFLLLPVEYAKLAKHVAGSLVFLSNFIYFKEINYFDIDAHYKILLHTWSLSVEWQFYLILPVILYLLNKWSFKEKYVFLLLLFCFSCSFIFSIWLTRNNPSGSFYLLHARAWEMLAGGMVYIIERKYQPRSEKIARIAEFAGWFLVLVSLVIIDVNSPWPGWYALLPVGGAAAILWANRQNSILTNNRLFQLIGSSSYSIYLWHWPIVVCLVYSGLEKSLAAVAGGLALTFIFGWFSYVGVEKKAAVYFREKARFFSLSRIAIPLAAVSATAILIFLKNGIPSHADPEVSRISGEIVMPMVDNGWCFYSVDTLKELSVGPAGLKCTLGDKSSHSRALMFGDSYAGHAEPFWNKIGQREHFQINSITTNWCFPSIDEKYPGPKASRAYEQCLLNRKYYKDHVGDYEIVILGGSWHDVVNIGGMQGLEEAIFLASRKARLVILLPSPTRYDKNIGLEFLRNLVLGKEFNFESIEKKSDSVVKDANKKIKDIAGKFANVIYLERDVIYPPSGIAMDSKKFSLPISLDGKHLSAFGALSSEVKFHKTENYSELAKKIQAAKISINKDPP